MSIFSAEILKKSRLLVFSPKGPPAPNDTEECFAAFTYSILNAKHHHRSQNVRRRCHMDLKSHTCGSHALRVRGDAQHSPPDYSGNFQICIFIDDRRPQEVILNLQNISDLHSSLILLLEFSVVKHLVSSTFGDIFFTLISKVLQFLSTIFRS